MRRMDPAAGERAADILIDYTDCDTVRDAVSIGMGDDPPWGPAHDVREHAGALRAVPTFATVLNDDTVLARSGLAAHAPQSRKNACRRPVEDRHGHGLSGQCTGAGHGGRQPRRCELHVRDPAPPLRRSDLIETA